MTYCAKLADAQYSFTPVAPMDDDSAAYLKALPPAAVGPQTPEARREAYRRARLLTQPDLPQVYDIKEYEVPGPKGPIPVRVYRGANTPSETPIPVFVFFHGGGWLVGNLETHDWICRSIANKMDGAVVNVDYRLAPENPFPAAYEDAVAATRWVVANAGSLHLDPEHVSVGGDSAGGNLAAAVALALRNEGATRLHSQVLIYPVVDLTMSGDYYGRFTRDVVLTDDAMRDYIEKYVPYAGLRKDWRASPLLAPSLEGLPPALVLLAGYDPLCAEGEAYADRLQKEGVPTILKLYPGQMHGFLSNAKLLPKAYEAIDEIGAFLNSAEQSSDGIG
jgi:acetyl esterase